MSPTGSTQLVSSSVPARRLSTPIDGVCPCAMRLPQAPQNHPNRCVPASDVHSMVRGSPATNEKPASGIVAGVEKAPPPIFWQFVQWQL
jgi:hypothetical protein